MRNRKTLSVFFIITFVFIAFFVFACSKKEPEPPKLSPSKVELPLPPPAEPLKKDMDEVKKESKTNDTEKQITEKHKIKIVKPVKKLKPVVIPPATDTKMQKQLRAVDFNRLNREFSKFGLNVWASESNNNEILLNGYVKNENERKAALSIARQYNANITDMINTVKAYDIGESGNKGVHQPLPFGK